jgi:hypothetical protein
LEPTKNLRSKRLKELGDILRFYGPKHPRHKAALKEIDDILGMPAELESEGEIYEEDGEQGTD